MPSDAAGSPNECVEWPPCDRGMGGRGNVCGGVIADARHLVGTGFEEFEGARVVSHHGNAIIQNGAFDLHAGVFSGCINQRLTYRIDVSSNGHCDDGVDLVYRAEGIFREGFDGLTVTADNPGIPRDCSEFPDGYDIDLALAPGCFANCGALRIALFDAGGTPVQTDAGGASAPVIETMFLDASYEGKPFVPLQGFAGLSSAGSDYVLRYYWVNGYFGDRCVGTEERMWEQTFRASASVNEIVLRATPGDAAPGACF
jgi:hypothetical protein